MLRLTRARIEITDGNLHRPLQLNWTDVGDVLAGGRVTEALIRRVSDLPVRAVLDATAIAAYCRGAIFRRRDHHSDHR